MVELIAAMTIMAVGMIALFGLFQSGIVSIRRASHVTTAAALADSEMERFRAVKFAVIGLVDGDANLVVDGADATYTADPAYRAVSDPANGLDSAVVLASTTYAPTKTVTGADGRPYRVDIFITWQEVTAAGSSGRPVKLVTVVIREGDGSPTWARVSSSFDESTGL